MQHCVMRSKADLHVHSKFSDRPGEWLLRRIGASECFVEPIDVYRRARERGMNFITISDHNSIDGCSEIAHLPGVFLSVEITTYFPEDGCKIHCLASGIDEEQFRMIEELRGDIYDLQKYLAAEEIIHTITHPLFRINDRLTVGHVEKLILLFNRFEGVNGSRDPRAADIARTLFRNLTPSMIEEMADRHDIEPQGSEPWQKHFTGGSDDHSGLYTASAFTHTPAASSVQEFLEFLRNGDHEAGGASGGSLRLGRSLYQIAFDYYTKKLIPADDKGDSLISALFQSLLDGALPQSLGRWTNFVPGFASQIIQSRRLKSLNPIERQLFEEFASLFNEKDESPSQANALDERKTFQTASRIGHVLSYAFLRKMTKYFQEGRFIDCLQTAASFVPVLGGLAPYFTAFSAQHKDEPFLKALARRFPATSHLAARPGGKAWIADCWEEDVVHTRTIESYVERAKVTARTLTVLTCLAEKTLTPNHKNFKPLGTIPLPECQDVKVAIPPFMDVIEYLEAGQFDEVIISTPGPMGLLGLLAAKLLGLRATVLFHLDYSRLVRHLTSDHGMERLAEKYLSWFLSIADEIIIPDPTMTDALAENGVDSRKIVSLMLGVENEGKTAAAAINAQKSRTYAERFQFVHISGPANDKDFPWILEAFDLLVAEAPQARLKIIHEGAVLPESLREASAARSNLTAVVWSDAEWESAKIESHALLLPPVADAFHRYFLEMQAAGAPAVVGQSDSHLVGIVRCFGSGRFVPDLRSDLLFEEMKIAATDFKRYEQMRQGAARAADAYAIEYLFERFWERADRLPSRNRLASLLAVTPEPRSGLISLEVS